MSSKKITLEVTVDQVNLILNALDQLPHKDVHETFESVLHQSNQQVIVKLQIPLDVEPAEERE